MKIDVRDIEAGPNPREVLIASGELRVRDAATDHARGSVLLIHRASSRTTRVNLQDMRKTSALTQR